MAATWTVPALAEADARLLCIGAHPDDLEIGAGGTLVRLLRAHPDLAVTWVVMTGTPERASEARASLVALLQRARGDAELRSTDRLVLHDLPDGRLPAHWEQTKDVVETCRSDAPALVIAPWHGDRHQDHRLLGELVWQTFRDTLIWQYEIPKYEGDLGRPNLFVQLADADVHAKVAHLEEHFGSQQGRSWFDPEAFRAILRLRGIESGNRWAEAFHVAKVVLDPDR